MLKRILTYVVASLLLIALGAALGYYSLPAEVKVETRIEYRDRIVEKEVVRVQTVYVQHKAVAKNVHTKSTTIESPDGTKVTTVETQDRTGIVLAESSQMALAGSRSREEDHASTQVATRTESRHNLNVLVLMAGTGLDFKPALGVTYTRTLLGPVGVGAWILKDDDLRGGVSLSLSF